LVDAGILKAEEKKAAKKETKKEDTEAAKS
jgi:hypothetical protein